MIINIILFLSLLTANEAAASDSLLHKVTRRTLEARSIFVETPFDEKDANIGGGGGISRRLQTWQHRFLLDDSDKKDTDGIFCDAAFLKCMEVGDCMDCFMELQTHDINWASVTKDTPCRDVVSFLDDKGYCKALKRSNDANNAFCDTFNTCVVFDDEIDLDDDDEYDDVDCDELDSCSFPGMHAQFIGDGICHEFMGGCYNSVACNYDGGDCCQDTCKSNSSYATCGSEGYACRDPASDHCNPLFAYECANTDDDAAGGSPSMAVDCMLGTTPYRLIMYDSFGDGWDETTLTITDENNTVIYSGGLENGSQGTDYLCLKKQALCYHVAVKGGRWGNEVSWEIKPMGEAPALAGGGTPMTCDFGISGGQCTGEKCGGKPNIKPSDDPEYKEFKEISDCIQKSCLIQVGACEKDTSCKACFGEDIPDYCFAIDTFNAVIDCALCQCTENKGSEYCATKSNPGAVIPNVKPGQDSQAVPCSPDQTLKGGKALLDFGQCTDFDQVSMMITNFDENHFGDLDKFEACAHSYTKEEHNGGHTALGCLQILVNAMNKAMDDENDPEDPTIPVDAIAALANLLYHKAESFCDCAAKASADCPLCPSFRNFKTLLYESIDACKSLDEIDCDAWSEYYRPCKKNMETKFGPTIDFSKKEQCTYLHESCGGAGPFPVFRRLDCDDEISGDAWNFYKIYAASCLDESDGDDSKPVPKPVTPSPVPAPVDPKPLPPSDNSSPANTGKKPYVPPEERKKNSSSNADQVPKEKKEKKKSHGFRNFVIFCLLCGAGYYIYKRRFSDFSLIRYRRVRNNFATDDNDLYSGLAMESSTSFEPPSLPPTPAAIGGSYGIN